MSSLLEQFFLETQFDFGDTSKEADSLQKCVMCSGKRKKVDFISSKIEAVVSIEEVLNHVNFQENLGMKPPTRCFYTLKEFINVSRLKKSWCESLSIFTSSLLHRIWTELTPGHNNIYCTCLFFFVFFYINSSTMACPQRTERWVSPSLNIHEPTPDIGIAAAQTPGFPHKRWFFIQLLVVSQSLSQYVAVI